MIKDKITDRRGYVATLRRLFWLVYTSWQGPFYPSNIENSGWLNYYSHVFDYVEIDSSFYRIPSVFMVNNWVKRTPKNFKFTGKPYYYVF
ncbi:MAG: DUF72 domain-containing protein [Candidatus Nitrosopolaris sp.]|jgi:uncharacterized protein YecE (DUF72 family)